MNKCKDCRFYKNGCAFDKFGEFVACAQFKKRQPAYINQEFEEAVKEMVENGRCRGNQEK